MDNPNISRRNFITAVGVSGAATIANLAPLQSMASDNFKQPDLPPDHVIKMFSTINLSAQEQEKIKAVSKNVDLQIVDGTTGAGC